jgi:hypothetical protein
MQCAYATLSLLAYLALHFFTLSHKRHDFQKKKPLLNVKYVFWFPLWLLSEIFFIIRKTEWCMIKYVYWSSCIVPSTHYSSQILMKLEYSQEVFEKYSSIKFNKNLSSGSWVAPCGRTDRHDEANSRFLQFCEHT